MRETFSTLRVQYLPDSVPYYQIVDSQDERIEEVELFLRETYSRRTNENTVRAYAFALLDWYRYLVTQQLDINEARRRDVTNYKLHLQKKENPQRIRHSKEAPAPGEVNPVTGKASLKAGYQSSTINQRMTVITLFYDMLLGEGLGPLIHPIPRPATRPRYHSTPGMPHQRGKRGPRQRQKQRLAHAIPRAALKRFRTEASCVRDTALIECLYVSGGRIAEVLAMTYGDVLWDIQRILLHTKGYKDKEEVAVSSKLLNILRQYLEERDDKLEPDSPLWITERGPKRPLTYTAARAVLRRLNVQFGSNVSAHDFRATCAVHLGENPRIPLTAIQDHLRHADVSTTQRYLSTARSSNTALVREALDAQDDVAPRLAALQYDPADLAALYDDEET